MITVWTSNVLLRLQANGDAMHDVNRADFTECKLLNIELSWPAYDTVIGITTTLEICPGDTKHS